ncbi:MAG TPA: aminotransferase class I/II-fold pyridoxal phosphate-dependent enzyme [Polyangiaceae bacterium]|nr:aminotransferase class I/II-fold pyridoxal phosphate-dependent enzyme [Polyangiaceae bacterium]
MTWLHDKTTTLLKRIEEAKEKRVFPYFRPFENVGARVKVGSGTYLNFMSNDYLGLSQDPRLIKRAVEGVHRFGTGLGSARPQATSVRHEELEARLARWTSKEACAVFTTGYQSLVGTLQAFLGDDTTLVLDRLCHASIIDGMLVAQGQCPDLEVRFFKHNDVASLDKALEGAAHEKRLIVAEGLYSVDGDMTPLSDVVAVARKHGAAIMLDDAHGLGTLGPTGRGVGELHGVLGEIDLLIGTFSKSFGTVGGFVCADRALVDYLKLSARSFVFSASLPIACVEAALAALDIMEADHALFRRLADNAAFFREGLHEVGLDTHGATTHITPIFLNDEILTMKFGAYLFHGADVMMMPFVAPGVPKGSERLRCNVTAAHTRADMGYTLEALAKIGTMLRVLPYGKSTRASTLQKAYWLANNRLRGIRRGGLAYVRHEVDRYLNPPRDDGD